MPLATDPLNEQVWEAQGDAWQAEGRLRASLGGGAVEWPGVRLMASGLPHPQWNNADVSDPRSFPLARVRAWYAARAHGAGVPWGVRVRAGHPFAYGRHLFRKRCMALRPSRFVRPAGVDGVEVRSAGPADAETVAAIDAAAFDEAVETTRPWIEPHLAAPGFTVALARLAGMPVGIATAIRTNEQAGPCAGVFGVGVLVPARGRGIGALLTSWLLERAFADGATLVHLNPNDDEAARLYQRLGFRETSGFDVYVGL